MKAAIIVTIVLVAIPAVAVQQPVATAWEVGPAFFVDNTAGVLGGWQDGPCLVATALREIGRDTRVEARLSFRPAAFETYNGFRPPYPPEIHYGDFYGEHGSFWRGSVGVRFGGLQTAHTYFALRTGVLVADLGIVARDAWSHDWDEVRTFEADCSNKTFTELFFAAGMGVTIPQLVRRGLVLETEMSIMPNMGGVSLLLGAYVLL